MSCAWITFSRDCDSEGLAISMCLWKAPQVSLIYSLGQEPLVGLIWGSRDLRSQRQWPPPHMYLQLGYSALKMYLNFFLTQILWLYFWFLQVASRLLPVMFWHGIAAASSPRGVGVWHFPQHLFKWVLWVPVLCEWIIFTAACYRLERWKLVPRHELLWALGHWVYNSCF